MQCVPCIQISVFYARIYLMYHHRIGALVCVILKAVSTRGYLHNRPNVLLFLRSTSFGSNTFAVEDGPDSAPIIPRRGRGGTSSCNSSISSRSTDIRTNMSTSAALSAARRVGKIVPSKTVFFACDIQERFRDLIHNMPAVISTSR